MMMVVMLRLKAEMHRLYSIEDDAIMMIRTMMMRLRRTIIITS